MNRASSFTGSDRPSRRHSLSRTIVPVSVIVGLCFAWAGMSSLSAELEKVVDGDPFRGRTLFVEKLCIRCHSIWGHGGALGPEIVRIVAGKPLPQLSGEFWNHTPRMIEEMAQTGHAWPTLSREEMADLLSYLYYLKLFDDPGDPARGAATVARLRCDSCHSVGGRGGATGGSLDAFAAFNSPVPLAQAMWNAGPDMQAAQIGRGTSIPRFSGSEMADIQAYIRERGIRSGDERPRLLPLPDPWVGEKLFRSKRCGSCHGTGASDAPDLGEATLRMTVTEIAGVLWNHSYAMQDQMRVRGIPFPEFREHELADLISYLHLLGYRGRAGDPERGASVFREKGCAACHERRMISAPDLVDSRSSQDAVALSAAMWNHAPEMHRAMAEHGVPWPKFEKGEVEDLVAYLGRLSSQGRADRPSGGDPQ